MVERVLRRPEAPRLTPTHMFSLVMSTRNIFFLRRSYFLSNIKTKGNVISSFLHKLDKFLNVTLRTLKQCIAEAGDRREGRQWGQLPSRGIADTDQW